MTTYHRFTTDEVTKQVMQCRLIGLMIEDCASMVNLAEQHGNLPTMLPKMQEMLEHLKMLADDASDDLNFMVWETTSKAPEERQSAEPDEMAALYIAWSPKPKGVIPAVKIIKDEFGFSLMEAKKIVDAAKNADVFVGYTDKAKAERVAAALLKENYFGQVMTRDNRDQYLSEMALSVDEILSN